jgi:hypothetical protein
VFGVVPFYYWSSSPSSIIHHAAWIVYFAGGDVGYGSKTLEYYIRAVRGGL